MKKEKKQYLSKVNTWRFPFFVKVLAPPLSVQQGVLIEVLT